MDVQESVSKSDETKDMWFIRWWIMTSWNDKQTLSKSQQLQHHHLYLEIIWPVDSSKELEICRTYYRDFTVTLTR